MSIYHSFVAVYPFPIEELFRSTTHSGIAVGANGVGTSATFVCGSFVRFSIQVDNEHKRVIEVRYKTNGCGFMIVTAELIAKAVEGQLLTDLHGLNDERLCQMISGKFGEIQPDRIHCRNTCFEALHSAFSDYRAFQLEEFQGEKLLICTCFGVTEETIEKVIAENATASVEEVGDVCNAGMGCGSCRMMIQEMIDQNASLTMMKIGD